MKYICSACIKKIPCVVELDKVGVEQPNRCIFDGTNKSNWKRYNPTNFEAKNKDLAAIKDILKEKLVAGKIYFGKQQFGWYIKVEKATYCDMCKFFKHEAINIKQCIYQDNIGSWENKLELNRHPFEINKNNDCNWFEKR